MERLISLYKFNSLGPQVNSVIHILQQFIVQVSYEFSLWLIEKVCTACKCLVLTLVCSYCHPKIYWPCTMLVHSSFFKIHFVIHLMSLSVYGSGTRNLLMLMKLYQWVQSMDMEWRMLRTGFYQNFLKGQRFIPRCQTCVLQIFSLLSFTKLVCHHL